jgi:hypothetical protein
MTCISNVAAQSASVGDLGGNEPSLHHSQRRKNTETCYVTAFRVHAPNKKGEHASTKAQKHNGHNEGHALPHDELVPQNGSSYIPP